MINFFLGMMLMLLTYLPLIMLGQLLLLSLFINIFLLQQNRKLVRTLQAKPVLLPEISESPAEILAYDQAEQTLFVQQTPFKAEPLLDYNATHVVEPKLFSLPPLVTPTPPMTKKSDEKKSFEPEDINSLLREITRIENKMKLKDTFDVTA